MNKKSCNHGELDEMEGKEDSSPKESDSSGKGAFTYDVRQVTLKNCKGM